tara:strand:+ start:811 stop:1374 length:564 start_codon:yes stop_codon:yes gene_type:complete
MQKILLRNKYKELRKRVSLDELEEKSIAIANQALQMEQLWNKEFYHIFLPISKHKEINTEPILSILNGMDKNIVISKSDFLTGELTHYLLTDNTTIKVNEWGIPEPEKGIIIDVKQLDVVFVPLLAYDLKGTRIGYGKGFYDRFLKKCREDCLIIGLSIFEPESEIDKNEHDVALTHCITDNKIHFF